MLKTNVFVSIIVLIFIGVTSCDTQRVFEENRDVENHVWHKDSVYTFIYDTDSIFEIPAMVFAFNVRNTIDYAYRNLWLFIEIELPNKMVIKDTLNLFLTDENGYWLKHVKGGSIKEARFYYKAKPKPPKGRYVIKIQHGMRDEKLGEIVSVGARIEKVELK